MRLRHEAPEPRYRSSAPTAEAVAAPMSALPSGIEVRSRHVPTFERAGKRLWRAARKRPAPKLTRRRAAITLALASLLGMRWIDAIQEPNWPRLVTTYPGATTGINAAHFYHAATEAYVGDGPRAALAMQHLPAGLPQWSALNEKEAPASLKRAAMDDNAAALQWLHEAGKHGYAGNFDGRWLKASVPVAPSLSNPVPNFILIRELARTAAGSCDILAADGRADLAVDRALDIAQWGVNLTHDPTLIEGMIGCLVQGIGWNKAMEHIDALTPGQAAAALARLERMPAPAGFDAMVRHEEAFGASMFHDLFKAGDLGPLSGGSSLTTPIGQVAGRAATGAMLLVYTKRGLVQNYTDLLDEYARLGAMPYRTSLPLSEALQRRVDRGEGLNWFTRMSAPNFLRARTAYEVRNATRELLRARLALKAWRGAHGAYPSSLDTLVADGLLARVPTDPFSADAAEPLRYDASTGKVWSVGGNGIDERGKGDDTLERF